MEIEVVLIDLKGNMSISKFETKKECMAFIKKLSKKTEIIWDSKSHVFITQQYMEK